MNADGIMRYGLRSCLLVSVVVAACGNVRDTPADASIRTVSVQRSHTGSGTVVSTIGGIACGMTCTASVLDGTVMILTAAPERLPPNKQAWGVGEIIAISNNRLLRVW